MSIKRPPLVNNEIYHIILRGAGDSRIFKDKNDYYRAIFSLYEFNTAKSVTIRERRKLRSRKKIARGLSSGNLSDNRILLVEILVFCFMPNHIHLLLKQLKDDGISLFMKKLGTGYASYFNKKYNRKGHLFQGRFKAIRIEDDEQLKIVVAYIHSNPLSLVERNWKEKRVKNPKAAIKFLENYKWSSYLDYIGKENFPSVTKRNFILETLGDEEGCRNFIKDLLEYKKEGFKIS